MFKRHSLRGVSLALSSLLLPLLAAGQIPQFTRIAVMGDSITGQTGDSHTYYRSGLWENLASRTSQQPELVWNGSLPHFSSSGRDSVFIEATDLPLVLQSSAEACILMAGTNDFYQQRSPHDTAAVLARMCRSLEKHSIVPVLCDTLPIAAGTPDKSAWLVQLKNEIDAVCASDPQILHIDWFRVLDPDGDGVADAAYFIDGLHPNANAMTRLGAYATPLIKPYLRPRDYLAGVTWLDSNPQMLGSGSTPDGWSIHPGTNTSTIQSALIPRPAAEGGGNWWQLSISGSSSFVPVELYAPVPVVGADDPAFQPGDAVEVVAEFETDSDIAPSWNLSPLVVTYPSYQVCGDSVTGAGGYDMPRVPAGVLRTPPLLIAPGTAAFGCILQITGTGTFRIGRVGVHRLAPTYSTWITASGVTDSAPAADPDHDGLSNHLEWLLKGNPAVNDAASLSEITPAAGGKAPMLSFHLNPAATDSRLTAERSGDLQTWSDFQPDATSDPKADLIRDPADASHWLLKGVEGSAADFFRFQSNWK